MSWTPQQKKVTELRGLNLLVSAAAGSGKTAVLVERILKRITDPENPVDIDRILVVTFTKAAAAEMRERIADALSERLAADPENPNLQRQSSLLQNAKISTIDSFCQSVIRNQFCRIDLEPGFRIGDEGEMKVLQKDVLGRLLEERYARSAQDPSFSHFTDHFGGDRSDEKLQEMILKVYNYAMSEPWPKKWLSQCREMYRFPEADPDAFLQSGWMREAADRLCAQIAGIAQAYTALIRRALLPGGPYMYERALRAEQRSLSAAAEQEDFLSLRDAVNAFRQEKLNPCRDPSVDGAIKKQVQDERTNLLKQVKNLRETYFTQTPAQMREQMLSAAGDADMLCTLTEEFMDAFLKEKRSKNVLDFSDLEHDALRILVDEETQRPTAAACEYQDFFEEIMIDEYQDSNHVQELLLMSISRQESENPNVFMVGDVKQSIYGFRLARPDLFMEKYRTYENAMPDEQSGAVSGRSMRNAKIELRTNFRSRPAVLNSVNAVFGRLMRRDIGGIDYGPEAALYPGEGIYPEEESEDYRTEILLTDGGIEAETALITDKIRKMTDPSNPLMIVDKSSGCMRPVSYRDIVILMRSLGEKAEKAAQQLNDAGIPAHVQSKTGYFASAEIRTLLSFLQIIDNPHQDIPLAAVLKSPIYALTGDQLAKIRAHSPDTDYYDAVVHYAAEGDDAGLKETLGGFKADLKDYRLQSRLLQIHELLAYLLHRSGYDKIVSAMGGGTQRLMNIRMLQERAAAFEKTSFHGLFQFNRYMEQLKTYEVDYGEASAVGENDDAVRIISIHKSKGLEYPVVFLAGLGRKFNRTDLSGEVLLHAKCGIGIDAFYADRRTKAPTILKKAIRMLNEAESMGEEMRVLYVGMTRAREKLILTASGEKAQEYADRLRCTADADRASASGEEDALSFYERIRAGCFMDWISEALAGREDAASVSFLPAEGLGEADARRIFERRTLYPYLKGRIAQADPEMVKMLRERFAAAQDLPAQDLPAKISVSELKLDRIRENGEDPEELFADTHRKAYVPVFARKEETDENGASYGTAVHRVMECLDFAHCAGELARSEAEESVCFRRQAAGEILGAQLQRMRTEGKISEDIYRVVSRRALTEFLCSELFLRMAAADRASRLFKERPFVMRVPASEVRADADARETVLVQGIMDAYFEENGKIILVDYKTDRVETAAQLTERYRRQMELYAQALTCGTGKTVSEMLLYSFALDEVCAVETRDEQDEE